MIVFMMKMMMMIITLNDRLAEEDFPVPGAGVSSPVKEQSDAPGVIIVQKPVLYSTPAKIKTPISAIFCSKRHVFQLHDNHLWIRGPSAAGHPLHALLLPPQSGKYDTLVLKRNLIA